MINLQGLAEEAGRQEGWGWPGLRLRGVCVCLILGTPGEGGSGRTTSLLTGVGRGCGGSCLGSTRRDRQWGGPASPALCPQGPWATGTAGSPARSVGETGRQEAAARPGEARSEPEVETEDPAQTPPPGPCPPGAPGYRRPPPTPGPPRHHSAHPPRVPICKARAPRVLSLQSPCAPAPSPHLGKFGRKRSEPASEPRVRAGRGRAPGPAGEGVAPA